MKRATVRPAVPEDAQNYSEWLQASAHINLMDKAVYTEPTLNTVVAELDGKPALMTSFRLVLCVEALAPKPGLTPKQEALALREMWAGIVRVAEASGIKEIVFQCVDQRLIRFIEKRGFTKIATDVFRYKV